MFLMKPFFKLNFVTVFFAPGFNLKIILQVVPQQIKIKLPLIEEPIAQGYEACQSGCLHVSCHTF